MGGVVNAAIMPVLCLPIVFMTSMSARASDFSAIHGFWSVANKTCKSSDEFWQIKASGASQIEEHCEVISSTRNGNRFVLKQQCAAEGNEYRRTESFRLLSSGQLQHGKYRYKRCPDPYNGGT